MVHRNLFLCILLLGIYGCGVKGRPLPPLNPAPLGRGEPALKNETQKSTNKKNKDGAVKQESSPAGTEEL